MGRDCAEDRDLLSTPVSPESNADWLALPDSPSPPVESVERFKRAYCIQKKEKKTAPIRIRKRVKEIRVGIT